MSTQHDIDPELQQRVRNALDAAADDLDMVVATRLESARRRAVARAGRRPWWSGWWGVLLPAGATAALLAALVYAPPRQEPEPAGPAEVVRDLDLLTSGESLDFYQDFELFRWMPAADRS